MGAGRAIPCDASRKDKGPLESSGPWLDPRRLGDDDASGDGSRAKYRHLIDWIVCMKSSKPFSATRNHRSWSVRNATIDA